MYNKIILLITVLFISACASKPEPYVFTDAQRAKAYTVRGQTYYPLVNADGFIERGHASWYGPGFHGKLTANGEVYNQNGMTAAHKHLPLGVYVYVQHLETKEIIRVKVNDRGPFIGDRVIDLSVGAAKELGMYEAGVAQVAIATSKSDLDNNPTFIASRDNNASSTLFKSTKPKPTSKAVETLATSLPATASTSAARPGTKTWSFQTSGKTYHDLRKEKYPESLTTIYEDDGTHPNPSYASTLKQNTATSTKKNTSSTNSSSTSQKQSYASNNSSASSNVNTTISQAGETQSTTENKTQVAQYMPIIGKGTVLIRLASYKTKEEAQKAAQIVHSLGLPTTIKSGTSHTLYSGPYETRKKASNSRAVLQFRFPKAKVL